MKGRTPQACLWVQSVTIDDDRCDMEYRIFDSEDKTRTAFRGYLEEYYRGYPIDLSEDCDCGGRSFEECVNDLSFCDDGFYLTAILMDVE